MEEDKEIIDALEICFQELTDKGFQVNIDQDYYYPVDFNENSIIKLCEVKYLKPNPSFRVIINRCKPFNIKDIKENILFTESYIKDMFNLNIIQLYILDYIQYYYKSIEYIPIDEDIYYIEIYFTKY